MEEKDSLAVDPLEKVTLDGPEKFTYISSLLSSSDDPASNESVKRFVPTVGPQNNVTLVTWLFIFFLLMPSYS